MKSNKSTETKSKEKTALISALTKKMMETWETLTQNFSKQLKNLDLITRESELYSSRCTNNKLLRKENKKSTRISMMKGKMVVLLFSTETKRISKKSTLRWQNNWSNFSRTKMRMEVREKTMKTSWLILTIWMTTKKLSSSNIFKKSTTKTQTICQCQRK